MEYFLSFDRPYEQVFLVRIKSQGGEEPVVFHLPRWRPGRYELQRYEINVADVRAYLPEGTSLELTRTSTHDWEVKAPVGQSFVFEYRYFANKLNAGGSYFDDERIFFNGINCLMYRQELLDKACSLHLNLPSGYRLGQGLTQVDGVIRAADYHELVDSPIMAGRDLRHHTFEVRGISFHFWMMGEGKPDLDRLEQDIRQIAEVQMGIFGGFPVEAYHFLFYFKSDSFRHGVEHHNSTAIVIGPGFKLNQPALYRSFIELCSHELFHIWNVKAIRPKEMLPYDYGKEAYSSLHYVTEGITTYYGDLSIWKAGLWSTEEWLQSVNGELRGFYQKGGKDYVSLEQASFESWVNGYHNAGMPNRKISFYTKGYLVAFLLDIELRRASGNNRCLDDVMATLYQRYGLTGVGYTREGFKEVVEEVAGEDFTDFFEKFYVGTAPLEAALQSAGAFVGWEMHLEPTDSWLESLLGFQLSQNDRGETCVEGVFPGSPAVRAGLAPGDELISLNGYKIQGNIHELVEHLGQERTYRFHLFRKRKLRECLLVLDGHYQLLTPQFAEVSNPTQRQIICRQAWQELRSPLKVLTRKL